MSCPEASIASGIMGCLPARIAKPSSIMFETGSPGSNRRRRPRRPRHPMNRRSRTNASHPRPLSSSPAHAAEAPCGASPSCRASPEPGRHPSPARRPGGRRHDPKPPADSDLPHRAASAAGATRAHQGTDSHTNGKIPTPTSRGPSKAREQGPMRSAIAATPLGKPQIPDRHADAQPIAKSEIPIDAADAEPLVRAWAVVGRRPIISRQSSRSPASENLHHPGRSNARF